MMKTKAPTDGRVGIKELIDFFQTSANKLTANGEEDSAFYFEQVADHLKQNPHKGLQEKVERILGI
jgi:hypothetical protein